MGSSSDDWCLLGAYASRRDEPAFASLVSRYVDLVYSAAARRVGAGHLAEDVTQAVFVILAKKANSIRRDAPLSAWLLSTVRYAAANARKIEARRRRHEQIAAQVRAAGACSSNPTDVLVWQEVARELDDAVLKLPALDRRAVLLRYFQDRPIADVAADLNVSEGAAKQRLTRAMDKLRHRLDRRGAAGVASIRSAGLATLLTTHAVRAAPAGLTKTACAASAAACGLAAGTATTTPTTATTIAKGAMHMMTWTKLKIAAAVVAAITIGGATGVITVKNAMAAAPQPPAAASPKPQPGDAAAAETKLKRKDNMGIISVADAPPVIVSTTPQAGAADVDAAATTEIKVTFSKEMETGGFSWVTYGKDTFPKTTGKAHFLDDKRTCVLPVKLEPGHPYVMWLNQGQFKGFSDTDGNKAVPYLLVFETK